MEGRFLVRSKRVQLAAVLAYATVMVVGVVWALDESIVAVPILMLALGLPLIFRLVPRNYLYGTRSARSLWTNEATWYRQNVITGVVMVLIGTIWLAVLAVLPLVALVAAQVPPSFEVASVTPQGLVRDRSVRTGNRYYEPSVTLRRVAEFGYDVPSFRIVGGPSWIDSDR
jgi:hypothetical protein